LTCIELPARRVRGIGLGLDGIAVIGAKVDSLGMLAALRR
jgi:hypothetical protein